MAKQQVQLPLFIPELTLGTHPLDWAPATKQPRKQREANFRRMCDACGKDIPGTGWRQGDLCGDCMPKREYDHPISLVCGELYKPSRCSCAPGECEAIPW